MKHKKEYIKPESLIQHVFDEDDLMGIITIPSENHGGFGAKQQDIVIEDDYDDEQEEQIFDLSHYKPWDDDQANENKSMSW